MKQVLAGIAAACLCGLVQAQVHTVQLTMDGTVNGAPLHAAGVATYNSLSPTNFTNDLSYAPLPPGYDPMAVVTVINTFICIADPPSMAINLATVTGGEFWLERQITITDATGAIVGALLLNGHLVTLDPANSNATVSITGAYSGPVGLTAVSGYDQFMHQVAPGHIQGHYTQTLTGPAGESLMLDAVTHWTYLGPGLLPGDEYSHMRLQACQYDPLARNLFLAGTGWYDMAQPVHTTQLTMDGVVNGAPLHTEGFATYDNSAPTYFTNDLTYTPLPPGYDPMAILTIVNTWRCHTTPEGGGAWNLAMVTGGEFWLERQITITDAGGTVVGSFMVNGHLGPGADPDHTLAVLNAQGNYTGPVGLVGVSGYDQFMHQLGPGQIRGHFTQTLTGPAGETLMLEAVTLWSYLGPGVLPGDEYSHLRVQTYQYDPLNRRLLLAATGWYDVVCDPDVNCDGAINGFDIEVMEQAVNGDMTNFCKGDPDFNHDGALNGFDIEAVEQSVNGAPCS
ncbi:hypothetical protein PHYC_03375 [Phycisphaerales bacterium]|nr:hypothetical protein PHYC_03375 [Phycisphaerales bacterium]